VNRLDWTFFPYRRTVCVVARERPEADYIRAADPAIEVSKEVSVV
jgi:hypothetical protein